MIRRPLGSLELEIISNVPGFGRTSDFPLRQPDDERGSRDGYIPEAYSCCRTCKGVLQAILRGSMRVSTLKCHARDLRSRGCRSCTGPGPTTHVTIFYIKGLSSFGLNCLILGWTKKRNILMFINRFPRPEEHSKSIFGVTRGMLSRYMRHAK